MRANINVLLASARLPFLILTPVSILLGIACAVAVTSEINWVDAALVLLTGLAAHVSVNTLNEYSDFRIGLDAITRKTPFSGGSGALPENPDQATNVLVLGVSALVVTLLGGLYLVLQSGWQLLVPGAIGLLLVACYSPWMTRSPTLSLISPGLAFGPLMVIGTAYVLTRQVTLTAILASMVPFFLVNNLLLLNQYPDIQADKTFGRRNLPILFGVIASGRVYLIFMLLAAAMIVTGIWLELMPWTSVIPLVLLVIMLPLALLAAQRIDDQKRLIPLLGVNVAVTLVVPVMLSVAMLTV